MYTSINVNISIIFNKKYVTEKINEYNTLKKYVKFTL